MALVTMPESTEEAFYTSRMLTLSARESVNAVVQVNHEELSASNLPISLKLTGTLTGGEEVTYEHILSMDSLEDGAPSFEEHVGSIYITTESGDIPESNKYGFSMQIANAYSNKDLSYSYQWCKTVYN